jgi:hypothetical protein
VTNIGLPRTETAFFFAGASLTNPELGWIRQPTCLQGDWGQAVTELDRHGPHHMSKTRVRATGVSQSGFCWTRLSGKKPDETNETFEMDRIWVADRPCRILTRLSPAPALRPYAPVTGTHHRAGYTGTRRSTSQLSLAQLRRVEHCGWGGQPRWDSSLCGPTLWDATPQQPAWRPVA